MAALAIGLGGRLVGGYINRRAAGKAQREAVEGYDAAQAGVLAAGQGAQDVLSEAGAKAPGQFRAGVDEAAEILGGAAERQQTQLDPFISAGQQGARGLADLAGRGFQFRYEDYANDPAFQFQLDRGTDALMKSASARGMLQSGNTAQGLAQFGQGLAATYYDQAFQRALKQFEQNRGVNRDLADIGLTGTGQSGTNERFFRGTMGENVIESGRYAGDTGLDIASKIASTKMRTGEAAAEYAADKGLVRAGGTLGKGAATAAIVGAGTKAGTNIYEQIIANRKARAIPAASDNFYWR